MKKSKTLTALSFLVLISIVVATGYIMYPRFYNDYLAVRDSSWTAKYYEPGDCWKYTYPDYHKMSLRAIAYRYPGILLAECIHRATPEQKELLVAAYPFNDADTDWLYNLPEDSWFSSSNTRRYLEIMHVIPTSDKHLSLEKAYKILSDCVPRLTAKLDKRDAMARQTNPRPERGKLTEYDVYIRILRRLNAYAICEDRSSERETVYDLTDEGDLCLIVQFRGYLSAYVKDKSNNKVRYLLFAAGEDADELLKKPYDLTYYIPLGN